MMPTDPDGPLSPVEAEVASRLRQVADEAADLYWPFSARDVIEVVPTWSGARRPHGGSLRRRRPWTHRLMVVAVAVAIVVVFFVPLPHLNLLKRLVSPAKPSPATRGTTLTVGTRLAALKAFDAVAGGGFGFSVAISGETAVVADIGDVYVFAESGSNWRQVAELKGPDDPAGDCTSDPSFGAFGNSVAIAGTTIVIGAPCYASEAGRAYVFTKTSSGWKQVTELKGSDSGADDGFGTSVAISSTTIVVGTHSRSRVYAFTERAGRWEQAAELKGSDTVMGDDFGYAVAISGTTIVVGADNAGTGQAYVFSKRAGSWTQVAELKGSGAVAADKFGYAVAISGTTILVGAYGYARDAGRVYVFTKTSTGWAQTEELKGTGSLAKAEFGCSLAVSGPMAVVGAFGDPSDGEAYVFEKTSTGWAQVATLRGFVTDPDAGIYGGISGLVDISGTTAVVSGDAASNYEGRAYLFRA